ncbi:MAG: ankyrin repeat domain-containing protein [Phycisphaerales bacterium JB052]
MMRLCVMMMCACLFGGPAFAQDQTEGVPVERDSRFDAVMAELVEQLRTCDGDNYESVIESIEAQIREGYYLNYKDPDGMTLLMHACRLPATHEITWWMIYNNRAKRDIRDNNGMLAMHHSAYNPDPKVAARAFGIFLAWRDDPNERDAHGRDILMHTLIANQPRGPVFLAIDATDADLNRLDDRGHSAVSHAAMHNHHHRIWELLAEHGADLTKTYTKDELTPLHLAARENMAEVAGAIIRAGAEVDALDASGMTPLMWALLQNKDPLMPRYLLQGGADATLVSDLGATMTHAAAYGGQNADVIKRIIDAGAAPDAPMPNNPTVTPARLYAQHGDDPAVWALLSEHGADLNRRGEYEPPTLMVAIDRGVSVEYAEAMIDAGCDVNALWVVANGSALLMACRGSSPEMISMLLDHGADATLVSAENKGVLEYAALNPKLKDHPVMERLRELAGE